MDGADARRKASSPRSVSSDRAAWAVDVLLQHATATAAEHSSRKESDTRTEDDALQAAVAGASEDTHPHVAAAGGDLFSGSGPERLAWGLRVLMNGVLATPRPT